MKRCFLALLLLANCAPFGDADPAPAASNADSTTAAPSAATSSPASSGTTAATATPAASTASAEPALWPVVGKKVTIPVCWDSSIPPGSNGSGNVRESVQNAVEAQWNVLSVLSFGGWADCVAGDVNTVRIKAASGSSSASGLGFAPSAEVRLDLTGDSNDAADDALHELGHIAGLGHEAVPAGDDVQQNICADFEKNVANDLPVTPPADRDVPDPNNSIMSRCNAFEGSSIAPADNKAIAGLYGLQPVNWSSIGAQDDIIQGRD